jgi:hypothetical protein
MAIYRHLSEASFEAGEIAQLSEAYEAALRKLRLKDRHDPVTELVAAKIIQVYRAGQHDPVKLCNRALRELGVPKAE